MNWNRVSITHHQPFAGRWASQEKHRRRQPPQPLRPSSGFKLCTALVFLLLAAAGTQAQGVCPLHVPAVCTQLAGEVANLKAERADLQTQLQQAAPGQKGALASQIKKLNSQIAVKEKLLATCNSTNGKQDLAANFFGTATFTTSNAKVSGPFVKHVEPGVVYQSWRRDQLVLASFPAIVVGPFSTPVGSNTTTVTLLGANCGVMDPQTGRLEISVVLKFDQSHILAGNSTLPLTLSTETAGGSRLDKAGAITLVGDGVFQNGYLGGDAAHVVLKGTLLPLP